MLKQIFNLPGLLISLALIASGIYVEYSFKSNYGNFLAHFLLEFGGVLFALSTLHILYERKLNEKIIRIIKEENDNRKVLNDLGIIKIRTELSDEELSLIMSKARHIKVLKTFFPETNKLKEGLKLAIVKNQANVELYLLKPESEILKCRSLSLNRTATGEEGKLKVQSIIRKFHKWKFTDKIALNSKIILFDSWPSIPMIKIDNAIFIGFYLSKKPSPEWPWLEVKEGTEFYKQLDNQFQIIDGEILINETDYEKYI